MVTWPWTNFTTFSCCLCCPINIISLCYNELRFSALPVKLLWLPPPRRICNRRCLFLCLSVCLFFVCLLATLRRNFRTDLREILSEGWQWFNEQMIKFWWRYASRNRIRIADTGYACLGGGMHSLCASSSYKVIVNVVWWLFMLYICMCLVW